MANIIGKIGGGNKIVGKISGMSNAAVEAELALKADKAETGARLDGADAQLAEIETKQGVLSGLLTTAKTSIVAAINELFNSKANKTQEAWMTPTLTNGWLNYGNPLSTAGYYKNDLKDVNIKGVVKGTLTGAANPIFTLPAGYRPSENLYFNVANDGGIAWVIINTQGFVYALGASFKSTWLSLDNIKFRVV